MTTCRIASMMSVTLATRAGYKLIVRECRLLRRSFDFVPRRSKDRLSLFSVYGASPCNNAYKLSSFFKGSSTFDTLTRI
jgi:hypothetical protein